MRSLSEPSANPNSVPVQTVVFQTPQSRVLAGGSLFEMRGQRPNAMPQCFEHWSVCLSVGDNNKPESHAYPATVRPSVVQSENER